MKKHIITYRKGYENVNCRITNVRSDILDDRPHLLPQIVGGCGV